MILTTENYYSPESNKEYLSVSLFNSFVGTPFKKGCEAKTVAALKGEWITEPSTAMLVGSYVDEYFSNTLDSFKATNPQLFLKSGKLKADFKNAEEVIACAEADELFMQYVKGDGEAQVVITGTIGGALWKGKIDRLHHGKAIVDLKVVESIHDKIWSDEDHGKINFVESYGYTGQAAVYQELWYQMSGDRLPFFIAAITKDKYPDKEIIQIPDETMKYKLEEIIENVPRIMQVKSGKFPPVKCGVCDYCRSIKKLENTITMYDL